MSLLDINCLMGFFLRYEPGIVDWVELNSLIHMYQGKKGKRYGEKYASNRKRLMYQGETLYFAQFWGENRVIWVCEYSGNVELATLLRLGVRLGVEIKGGHIGSGKIT
ncbi:hypothetical protein PIL02S_03488 [Paenibacillus illinoisensis]|uniref:Uncharacterized protein n=1 Tax=Paenibacillus illinoisensis TaxID=59845 RepID=A0A2W0C8G5_9BACL|nr:hypothetical protein PIL02S_03488 [Paenibacillus illinoisensis]